jgi:carbon-monoxide dehydrogenase medium subunit
VGSPKELPDTLENHREEENKTSKLFRPKGYFRPMTIEEAVSLLAKHGETARPIAGGTDLLVEKPGEVEYLIDITHVPLDYIRKDQHTLGINIGALTTLGSIETCALFEDVGYEAYGVLAEVAHKMGSPTTRNVATIGGNICNAVPSADFPPVLIALDAKAKIAGAKGDRTIALEDFFVHVRKTVSKSNELLTEIQIPRQPPLTGVAFFKLGRVHVDIALVNVAARVTLRPDEVCEEVRIVLGAVAPTPIRAKKAERLLQGEKIEDAPIKRAAQVASEETRPISDVRARADYRRDMCKVLVERALKQAFERARRR